MFIDVKEMQKRQIEVSDTISGEFTSRKKHSKGAEIKASRHQDRLGELVREAKLRRLLLIATRRQERPLQATQVL